MPQAEPSVNQHRCFSFSPRERAAAQWNVLPPSTASAAPGTNDDSSLVK